MDNLCVIPNISLNKQDTYRFIDNYKYMVYNKNILYHKGKIAERQ